MFESEFMNRLIEFLPNYSPVVGFFSTIFGGENGVLFVSFLAGQGFFYLPYIILFSFFAMILLDSFWFFFSKTRIFGKLKKWKKISKQYSSVQEHINKITAGKDMLLLLIAKFLIGTRILVILYLSSKDMPFSKFTKYNTPPTLIWAIFLGVSGWLAGRGFEIVWRLFNSIKIAISFLILIIILYYLMMKGINKWLMKKRKKLI